MSVIVGGLIGIGNCLLCWSDRDSQWVRKRFIKNVTPACLRSWLEVSVVVCIWKCDAVGGRQCMNPRLESIRVTLHYVNRYAFLMVRFTRCCAWARCVLTNTLLLFRAAVCRSDKYALIAETYCLKKARCAYGKIWIELFETVVTRTFALTFAVTKAFQIFPGLPDSRINDTCITITYDCLASGDRSLWQ